MTLDNQMKIHQSVHGYDSGHKLMSCSLNLPKSTQSMMSKMSDASLTGYSSSLKPYITGYPLPEIGAYAIAKTWPAPEMPRPGCVWTHTLIIDYADLALIKDATILLELFKKPSLEQVYKYKEGITFQPDSSSFVKEQLIHTSSIAPIIFDIYNSALNKIRYPSIENAEEITLLIWSQQWPKLRRNFSFRTLVSKSSNSTEFDLSFTTEYYSNNFERSTVEAEWLKSAEEDLSVMGSDFRAFLWRYGAACTKYRESYIPLVKVYSALQSNKLNDGLSTALKICLGWPGCPTTLLVNLVNVAFDQINDVEDTHIINLMLKVISKLKTIDNGYISVYKKLGELVGKFSSSKISEFINNLNENQKEFSESIVKNIHISKLEPLIPLVNYDINQIFNLRNDICLLPVYWYSKNTLSPEIINLIDSKELFLSDIMSAALMAHNNDVIEDFIREYKTEAVSYILKSMCEQNEFNNLARAVSRNQKYLFEAFNTFETLPLALLDSVSSYIDPRVLISRNEKDIWISMISKNERQKLNYHIDFSIFLFVRAFHSPSNAENLLALTMDIIVDSLYKQSLTYKQWSRVEKVIMPLAWWDWDKCEQLLKAVVNLFVRNGIQLDDNSKITSSPILLKRILKLYKLFK